MNRKSSGGFLIFQFVLAAAVSLNAAQLKEARVTQVIRDVKLLGGAAPRAATISDNVREGMGVRTGLDSRAELTFSDLTITRLGENTVFSFNEDRREVSLDSGALLLQVPKGGAAARINSAVATAAISGGTALFEANKGYPAKLLVLEGKGVFCSREHPEQCETALAGQMVTMNLNGEISKPQRFNLKKVVETSRLLQDFAPLPNLDLILQAIELQSEEVGNPPNNPPRDPVDTIDQHEAALPPVSSSPPPEGPSKFGPPPTITSPDPYVINSTTQIQTDPTIATNGVTDSGTIYRGPAQDGSQFDFLFGSTSAFDATIGNFFNTNGNGVPVAVFKFSHLQLVGDPTITIPGGATTFLGLVSVGDVTSGSPGGTLSFAGLDRLFIATVNGSITLGPEIGFSGLGHVTLYARGAGSNVTMGSAISNAAVVHFFAEGTVQVNGNITATSDFRSFSGGDFLEGSGIVTTTDLDIQSLSNITVHSNQYQGPVGGGGTINLNAGNTLTIIHDGHGNGSQPDSLTAQGTTINFQSSNLDTFDIPNASFIAGSGGIQAPNVLFASGDSLLLQTTHGGDINIYGRESPSNGNGGNESVGTIDAAGAVNATTNITNVRDLTAGTSVSVGGDLGADHIMAGTTVDVGGDIFADTLSAGGNIDALGVQVITINAPTSLLTVGSDGIQPAIREPDGAAGQHTFNVDSIVSAGGIDFSGNQFGSISGLSSGGRLTVNSNTLTFDSEAGVAFANFNGADAGNFIPPIPNGGDGGIFIVNATGNITGNSGADITATTGFNSDAGVYSGAGGSVTLHSTGGMVTVNNRIEVSSDDPEAQRQSASGGDINLTSNRASGVAISVTNSGQLLSLLSGAAPGPGGKITILATGASSEADISGTVHADRGTVDIRQTGDDGVIALGGPEIPGRPTGGQPGDFIDLHGDIVKVGALGTNGTLTIGQGTISAGSTLQLYAGGSNGLLHFVANVTLSSNSAMHLAANTITIDSGMTVHVNGDGGPANVFTNHPDYNFTPGPGYTGPPPNANNGSFGNNGAHDPVPLANAPPFDPPRNGRGH